MPNCSSINVESLRIAVILGTRPEIVKLAPVIREGICRDIDRFVIHTGQHYDREMSESFFEDLELPPPDYQLHVGSGTHAAQTAKALEKIEEVLIREHPSLVLVQGDTNTTLAGALASVKLGIPVAHVEAGLRSYDLRMPEEFNRRLTDHLSSILFAPTKTAVRILRKEDVWGSVYLTGNTVIDACEQHIPLAMRKSRIMSEIGFNEFCLATVHRKENVDDPVVLKNFVDAFKYSPLPVVIPLHPRTKKRLEEYGLLPELKNSSNVKLLPSLGYLDFLRLMVECKLILTDSGGVQEEATSPSIRKRVLVLRLSTDRPEAIKAGYGKLVGVDSESILAEIERYLEDPTLPTSPSPYGDGKAAKRIVDITETKPLPELGILRERLDRMLRG